MPDPDHESGTQDWTMNPDVRLTLAGTQESSKRPVVLVTGAAGSLGKDMVQILLQSGAIVRAMDISEAGLASLAYDVHINPYIEQNRALRVIYGDIRDPDRVTMAARGADYIIHAAAMKNLTVAGANPWETIRTNVEGTRNVGLAAIANKVNRAVFISSDKAVDPTTLYGTTKLLGEQLWLWFSRIQERTHFSIFRSGNFMPSAGSVFEVWQRQHEQKMPLTITDLNMYRYFIVLSEAAQIAVDMLYDSRNAEVFVPKMERIRVMDLMNQMYPNDDFRVTGPIPGEKLDEKLLNDYEKPSRETERYWVVER